MEVFPVLIPIPEHTGLAIDPLSGRVYMGPGKEDPRID